MANVDQNEFSPEEAAAAYAEVKNGFEGVLPKDGDKQFTVIMRPDTHFLYLGREGEQQLLWDRDGAYEISESGELKDLVAGKAAPKKAVEYARVMKEGREIDHPPLSPAMEVMNIQRLAAEQARGERHDREHPPVRDRETFEAVTQVAELVYEYMYPRDRSYPDETTRELGSRGIRSERPDPAKDQMEQGLIMVAEKGVPKELWTPWGKYELPGGHLGISAQEWRERLPELLEQLGAEEYEGPPDVVAAMKAIKEDRIRRGVEQEGDEKAEKDVVPDYAEYVLTQVDGTPIPAAKERRGGYARDAEDQRRTRESWDELVSSANE